MLESRRFQAAYAVFLPEAEKGDARAAFEAGRLLLAGRGVEKDEASGAKWVLASAEGGYRDAQYLMGALSVYGIGVEKDSQVALTWFSKAAAAGDARAAHGDGDFDRFGRGRGQSPAGSGFMV